MLRRCSEMPISYGTYWRWHSIWGRDYYPLSGLVVYFSYDARPRPILRLLHHVTSQQPRECIPCCPRWVTLSWYPTRSNETASRAYISHNSIATMTYLLLISYIVVSCISFRPSTSHTSYWNYDFSNSLWWSVVVYCCWDSSDADMCMSLVKKQDTKLLPITSANVNRFSKFTTVLGVSGKGWRDIKKSEKTRIASIYLYEMEWNVKNEMSSSFR